jgi:hypothetical protein
MLGARYQGQGCVRVEEPKHVNAAIVVDIELDHTVAQVLMWPNGMLDLHVISIDSGHDIALETCEIDSGDTLETVLARASELIAANQSGSQ